MDRVCVVTGAATGIGRATCLALAEAGYASIAVGFNADFEAAADTVKQLEALGCRSVAVQADISDLAAVQRMITTVVNEFGRLDVLVNNAGATRSIPFQKLDDVSDEVWQYIMDINLRGHFYCSRSAAPYLKTAQGAIVNVASMSALRPTGSSLPYVVAKAGLMQLTKALALALAPEIRVNAVLPGFVQTQWHEDLVGAEGAAISADAALARTPLGRLAQPDDVARAIVAILSVDFVTGQGLVIDGGRELLY